MDDVTVIEGQAAVRAALGDDPYVRLMTAHENTTAYLGTGACVFIGVGTWGPACCALGDPAAAVALVAGLRARGALGGINALQLPPVDPDMLGAVLPVVRRNDWHFMWTSKAPSDQPGEDAVSLLGPGDHADINDVLDAALPESTTRPGDGIGRWYGIRSAGRLIACGADRGGPGIAMLAGIGVHPHVQGRGYGAALTASITRQRLAEVPVVGLGVLSHNTGAIRLYRRIGFTGSLARSSVEIG